MSIYETSVRKPVTTALIFVAVMFLGLFSYQRLAVDLYPDIDFPNLMVITAYGGAGAEDIESNLSEVIENSLNTVSNLKKLRSNSRDNVSIVTLEFEWGTNLDEATNEVREAMARTERQLPEGVEKPIIFKFSSSMMPIMFITASARESFPALNRILEDQVANPLNRIDGLGSVSVAGGPTREIQVNVDPKRLEAFNMSVEQIGAVIAQENMNMPGGIIDVGSSTLALRVEGEFTSSDQIQDIIVSNFMGRPVYLRDVATVVDTTRELSQIVTANGNPSAQMIIFKQSGANTVSVCREIRNMLPELTQTLPSDVDLTIALDFSEFIENSVNSLTMTVFMTLLAVAITILIFLGRWRATIIIVTVIPVSLVSAFIYLLLTGNTLNLITLSSLTICISLVVDDAIVILENIMRHIKKGSSPREAAIYATNEVSLAVIATTFTLLAVFLPLTFLGGMAGIMFKPLGWIIAIVTTVSTLVALTLTPMMASTMLKSTEDEKKDGFFARLYRPIERALEALDNSYAKLLHWAISRRALVLILATVTFISSIFLVFRVGTDFFPQSDNSQIAITVELPIGVNKHYTQEVCERIEANFATKYPEIRNYTMTVGATDENNAFGALFGRSGTNIGTFSIRLTDVKSRERSVFEIMDLLRQDIAQIPDIVKFDVNDGGGGFGGGAPIEVKIFGHDIDQTMAIAEELKTRMEGVKGTRDVAISHEEKKLDLRLELDRQKLAMHGLNTRTVAMNVRNRINGMEASKFREDGNEYNIIVRYDKQFRESVQSVENIMVFNNQGRGIRVSELGRVVEGYTLPEISRENRQRVIIVSSSIHGEPLGNITAALNAELKQMEFPDGVYTQIGGQAADQAEAFADLGMLALLIFGLVFIVMASQFESFRMPFIIIISVFFAFTGVFITLFITGTSLSVIAFIGAIMLIGIVVKNGIVLVDFTNLQRDRGLSLSHAVITAGHSRLRPVLMTSVTTVLGMLPVAIGIGEGSEIWQPMGIAIVGGVIFSTILTMIVVPVIYTMFGAGRMKSERKRMAKLNDAIGG
ncbi:MAG: efflux RND transporter permease subunit [Bacteroidales bacterium]|jgi:hydrophobe/amphiphile efflux-1 (HAE1) family protein|nr:efflux RND transporter permease subunit [Bacteroidales bacterium]